MPETPRATFLFALVCCILLAAGCVPGTVEVEEPDSERSQLATNPDSGESDRLGEPSSSGSDTGTDDGSRAGDDDGSTEDAETDPPDEESDPDLGNEGDAGDEETCPAGQDTCNEMCVDLTADAQHCGACDNSCPENSACDEAACQCSNPSQEICADTCVDTTTSNQHCGACDNPCSGGQLCIDSQCVNSTEVAGVLQATNQARADGADCGVYGIKDPVPALMGDADLHEAAQAHADDMSANNFFSHTGSDGSSFSQRVGRTSYTGFAIGENIAAGQGSPNAAVTGWVNSDGHCRNLMNPQATKIGIGYATGGPYGTLWVQVFGQ